jgi:hypothetical protein
MDVHVYGDDDDEVPYDAIAEVLMFNYKWLVRSFDAAAIDEEDENEPEWDPEYVWHLTRDEGGAPVLYRYRLVSVRPKTYVVTGAPDNACPGGPRKILPRDHPAVYTDPEPALKAWSQEISSYRKPARHRLNKLTSESAQIQARLEQLDDASERIATKLEWIALIR